MSKIIYRGVSIGNSGKQSLKNHGVILPFGVLEQRVKKESL